MDKRQNFFINDSDRIFTVRLMWSIGQPWVCGTIDKVVEYALEPNNGIEGIYEILGKEIYKISKKDLYEILGYRFPELLERIKKIY